MKFTLILLASLFLSLGLSFAATPPAGSIDIRGMPASDVLNLYKKTSGIELVVDSRVKQVLASITFRSTAPMTKAEMLKLIQKALLTQARIVITPLDDKQESVTFNDALPINR